MTAQNLDLFSNQIKQMEFELNYVRSKGRANDIYSQSELSKLNDKLFKGANSHLQTVDIPVNKLTERVVYFFEAKLVDAQNKQINNNTILKKIVLDDPKKNYIKIEDAEERIRVANKSNITVSKVSD